MKTRLVGLAIFAAASAMVLLAESFIAAYFNVPAILVPMVLQSAVIGVIVGTVVNTIEDENEKKRRTI